MAVGVDVVLGTCVEVEVGGGVAVAVAMGGGVAGLQAARVSRRRMGRSRIGFV